MGIYIKIDKLTQEDMVMARYHVTTEAFGGANFYIELDKKKKTIAFFLDSLFIEPIRIINLMDSNELVGTLPNVDSRILSRVIMRLISAISEEKFPEFLDYAA